MPRVGFEPTIPAFELAKTVYALDRSGRVTSTREPCLLDSWHEVVKFSFLRLIQKLTARQVKVAPSYRETC
jgi:hypothetical protein